MVAAAFDDGCGVPVDEGGDKGWAAILRFAHPLPPAVVLVTAHAVVAAAAAEA